MGTLLLRKWAQSLHKMFVVIGIIASNLAANIKTQTVHIHAEYTTVDLKQAHKLVQVDALEILCNTL